ncbi:hypothetical protein BJN34_0250 [Cupriavidus necator]|uniref:Uncharacterized protein n=1 Tax=Cupriavidus necator TaxID=106590 RepID=A0A2P1DV09_CUPNE|nr:protein phosphatase CheZ [Cupriavidus necator]AVK72231.1 hypothetical protein BJN34_0250 [Cupriavidus necator]
MMAQDFRDLTGQLIKKMIQAQVDDLLASLGF